MSAGYDRDNREGATIKRFYDFGIFRIDTSKRLLLKDGEPVQLTPKAFDTLLLLVENKGRLVSKDELMSRLWPDTVVEEGSLTRNVYLLRKALGEAPQQHLYIMTVPGQGYRFVADVSEISEQNLDLKVTERTRTTIVVSEEEREDLPEELPEIPLAPMTARAQLSAPALENRAPERRRTDGPLIARIIRHKTAIAICALAAIGVTIWLYASNRWGRPESRPTNSSQGMTITNLTTTGNVVCAGISPDGNYVAYARADSLQLSSLWIMQPATFTSQLVIPPAEVQYHALTFSPEGNYIYYVMRENNGAARALYRVSLLGGPSKRLASKVETAVSFSPDGAQIVFRRGLDDRKESALFIANADGTGEKEIAAIKAPEAFGDPAWSPDSKAIACAAGHASGGKNMYVVRVSVGDWTVKHVSSQRWRWVGQLSWVSDSTGLMMVASEAPSEPYQVWHLSYPGGETQKITNDSNFYNSLSMSADSSALVASQRQLDSKVWIIPAEDASRAKQITYGSGGYRMRLSWTPDGKIVYDSYAGNSTAISIMNADGSEPKNLVGDMTGRAILYYSTVSPDGRYIVYASDLTGARHIWRMNIDGSNPMRLTDGSGEDHPSCSPDGKWVFYISMNPDKPSLWKTPIEGGEPVRLIDAITSSPAVSPDGKLIACLYAEPNSPWQIAVFSIEGGQPIKLFPNIQSPTALRWTPDGRGITYGENPIGASKISIQPLEGGPPKRVIELATDRVFDFDWSPDGKQLACIRGIWAKNIVLIKNFR
jgi:Tol biopolymer transport system component/DNA-binding winged helix-turn-helix (wHTH) protein